MGKYKKNHPGAKRAESTYDVCMRGDLNADWQAADRALRRAIDERRSSDSKEDAGLDALVERVRALEAQMLEHTETWRLQAMPKYKFRALVDAHPPRRGEDDEPIDVDRSLGLNRDTFFPALIRASVVDPTGLDDEDWRWLLGDTDSERERLVAEDQADQIEDGVLNDRQAGDLEDIAWFLNRDGVNVPFSHAASLVSQTSAGE